MRELGEELRSFYMGVRAWYSYAQANEKNNVCGELQLP
jgi:hypothetical protein